MKHISLLYLFFLCLCHSQMSAQCDNTLVDKAVSQSGVGAVYLRDFKVKFDGPEKGKAIPTAKYPVLLSKNTTYRFNVCNAEEYDGKVILQLFLKDKLIGSTFDVQTSTDLQRFDFKSEKATTYEVVMSFDQGKPGCAVGILSMVSDKAEAAPDDEELDILYAQADNPMVIYDDEDEYAEIDVTINNGTVAKVEGVNYIIRPEETGTALLSMRVLNRNGTLREFKQKRFAVLTLDKPYATLRGVLGHFVSRQELIQSRLDLWYSEGMKCNYKIISFTISDRDDLISGITSTSSRFSRSQRDWLNSLPSGTRVYFKNIQARTAENVVIDIAGIDVETR